jgi:hypothetical protein
LTTSDTYARQRTDNSIVELTLTGAEDMLADLNSFLADGFRINKTASIDATVIHYLALQGAKYRVGSFNKTTDTAVPVDQSVAGVSLQPVGLILVSKNLPSNEPIRVKAF